MLLFNGTFTIIDFDKYNLNLYLIMVNAEISIASYNCNGLADNRKRPGGSYIFLPGGKELQNGLMVLINSHFDPNVQIVQTDSQGRWMIFTGP